MLTHIVCWKYKPEITEETRKEHIAKLNDLPNHVPNIISLKAGADMLHLDRSFDTGLVAVFENKEALDAYSVHPVHQKIVEFTKQIVQQGVSVDFVD